MLGEKEEGEEMNLWFTADTHFGHANIIEYCKRPFKSLEEMNSKLIKNWNERVKEDDMVIFLGDFCFKNSSDRGEGVDFNWRHYREQLNGEIVFLKGNHDGNNSLNTKIKNLVIEYGGEKFFCTHDPADVNVEYKINLCGHVHEVWKINSIAGFNNSHSRVAETIIVNVGVDQWDFRPIKMEEILEAVKKYEGGIR
jgi:calcineurin-like phosphoesterase family protein